VRCAEPRQIGVLHVCAELATGAPQCTNGRKRQAAHDELEGVQGKGLKHDRADSSTLLPASPI
jgi:hypothetical protein